MITEPLRTEHSELLPEIDRLVDAAESIGVEPISEVRRRVAGAREFLNQHLIPHAQTEDRVLYPEVERILGAAGATASMSRDHEEVGALARELGRLESELAGDSVDERAGRDLRRVLYGLHAIVRLHFSKEEEVFLPLLDQKLSADEGATLFSRMESVAAQIKAG